MTVTGVNDAPVAVDDTLSGVSEDDDATAVGNVLMNDSDPDASDDLTVTPQTNAAGSSGGLFSVTANGDVTFDPNGEFEDLAVGETRTTSFTYTINDGHGGTATATASVTVTGENDAPVAVDDTAITSEPESISGNLLANDSDPNGDLLSITHIDGQPVTDGQTVTLASGARLTIHADGSYTYDPNGAFSDLGEHETASDSFTYTVSDGAGGTATATATVTVTGLDTRGAITIDPKAIAAGKSRIKLIANDGAPVDLRVEFTDSGVILIGENGTTINGVTMLTLDGVTQLRGTFGDGDDNLTIIGDAKKARFDLGGGNNSIVFEGFTSARQTSVFSKAGSLHLTAIDSTFGRLRVIGGQSDDTLTFVNVEVDRTLLKLFGGADRIFIDDSTFAGRFSVFSGGAGASLNVETGEANGIGTQFLGRFRYSTGANPLILLAPEADLDGVTFGKKSAFLAEPPAGTLVAGSQVNFARRPQLKNIST